MKFFLAIILFFSSFLAFSQELAPQKSYNSYGYVDDLDNWVVKPQFDKALAFKEGLAAVRTKNSSYKYNWGFIDQSGKYVIEPQFEDVESFSEGLAAVKIKDYWGYIDKTGKIVIKPTYQSAESFSEGLAKIRKDGGDGFIDKAGKIVVKPTYYKAKSFSEGLAAVQLKYEGKWGYIDRTGEVFIKPQFEDAWSFTEGLAQAETKKGIGYIDKTGNFVIKPQYRMSRRFTNGLAAVWRGKWGFIDKTGNYVAEPQFDDTYFLQEIGEGMFPVRLDKKIGFMDTGGNVVIEPQFSSVGTFKDGVAKVFVDDQPFYIDKKGNRYPNRAIARISSTTLQQYLNKELGSWDDYFRESGVTPLTEADLISKVQAEIEPWQRKDQFETTEQWQQRVSEQSRTAKAKEIADRISQKYNSQVQRVRQEYNNKAESIVRWFCDVKSKAFSLQPMELMPYDADNQSFLIRTEHSGDILLPVPLAEAKAFYNDWKKSSVNAVYVPSGSDVALQKVAFGKYVYDSETKADYALVDVDYNFRPIDINSLNYQLSAIDDSTAPATKVSTESTGITARNVTPETRKVAAGTLSDVDRDIPEGKLKAENTFAVVIANSNYAHASRVENAANDGRTMAQYLTRTLGLPDNNVTTCIDATYGQIKSAVAHLRDIADAFGKDNFNVIFYYVGHGLPDESSKESYLLPVDVDPRLTDACYPLGGLYKDLADLGASNVTVIIDACFSGSNFGDGMLVAQSMGVRIAPKQAAPTGRMVVLSASQGDQTAFPYEEKGHGLFTYYILKKLQDSKGNLTLGELSEYVTDRVSKTSVTVNHKPQTPSVAVSPSLQSAWRDMPVGR